MDSKQGIHVMTLANSIIGVSILAMPYCFKQCGIILSIILLIFSSILSRLACHFLLKSAIKARLRTFEFLAYHVFGSLGKLFVEIGMIGFLIGTCIAFFVVMGDLGPQIVSHMTGTESTDTLRTTILVALAIFCVLPLGLLRNVDSLSGVCTATIGFYACLVLKIMGESASHIIVGDWVDQVNYWRPAGILQCIPIFSMALFCQTQLFEIYQAIPNASLEKMNNLVRLAVNICTCVYVFVGVFGYIAICHEGNFAGNILMNFRPSVMTEVMKIGFVLSVAFSFPLVIFPCRASLYSLIYKPTYTALHENTALYIPEVRFKLLTFLIVLISLIIGVLIPNIELVLGLVGSTIGVMICVLFPATCFICLTSKNTNERILAQMMLFIGIVMLVLGTYANLYAMEQVSHAPITEKPESLSKEANLKISEDKIAITTVSNLLKKAVEISNKEIRHEPPQPEAPPDEPQVVVEEPKQKDAAVEVNQPAPIQKEPPKPKNSKKLQININTSAKLEPSDSLVKIVAVTEKLGLPTAKTNELDKEAIKKEDKELEQGDQDLSKQQKLYEKQQKLMEAHQKLLNEFQLRQEKELIERENVKKEKLKAVKNIENIARLAIESLVEAEKPDKGNQSKSMGVGLNPDQNLVNRGSDVLKNLAPLPIRLANNNQQAVNNEKPKINVVNLLNGDGINGIAQKLDVNAGQNKLENPVVNSLEAATNKVDAANAIKPMIDKNEDEKPVLANEDLNNSPLGDKAKVNKAETDPAIDTGPKNQEEAKDSKNIVNNVESENKNIVADEVKVDAKVAANMDKVKVSVKKIDVSDNAAINTDKKNDPDMKAKEMGKEDEIQDPDVKANEKGKEDEKHNDNVDSMRRDILSNDNYLRKRRDVAEEEHCEKTTELMTPKDLSSEV